MGEPSKLVDELGAIVAGERDLLANLANCAALLFHGLADVNWAGFYLLKGQQLVQGPFQGRPACVRIDVGRGVCGTAAERRETIVVPDVHCFAGHIACDEPMLDEIRRHCALLLSEDFATHSAAYFWLRDCPPFRRVLDRLRQRELSLFEIAACLAAGTA